MGLAAHSYCKYICLRQIACCISYIRVRSTLITYAACHLYNWAAPSYIYTCCRLFALYHGPVAHDIAHSKKDFPAYIVVLRTTITSVNLSCMQRLLQLKWCCAPLSRCKSLLSSPNSINYNGLRAIIMQVISALNTGLRPVFSAVKSPAAAFLHGLCSAAHCLRPCKMHCYQPAAKPYIVVLRTTIMHLQQALYTGLRPV